MLDFNKSLYFKSYLVELTPIKNEKGDSKIPSNSVYSGKFIIMG